MSSPQPGKILHKINSPQDLRQQLKVGELQPLADELRDFIIDVVSKKGGHLGASLGVVEMTVAIHYAFNTPHDLLIWDVGHQAYGHKILTGRRDQFHTNRSFKGLSGFPKRNESEFDTFGTGHASTSISAALGMAVANDLDNHDRQHIAVIGDGAMTGGMAFEALNHAGVENTNLLIILNDNCMSIDPNVGALKSYLMNMSTAGAYDKLKKDAWTILSKMSKFGPNAKSVVAKIEKRAKESLLKKGSFFESLNFDYYGPVDGHDIEGMVAMMKKLQKVSGPKILHCITKKGKGYSPAESGDQTLWHAPGIFNKSTGELIKSKENDSIPKWQEVFGETLVELAEKNPDIVAITPAMPTGSSLNKMMQRFPERTFDVGIAEQHAVTFSAGLATQGKIPFCCIYSTFLQRAYDQVIHDVALQQLPVIFCLDRAGLVGEDGATHHGAYDMAFLRCIPNMILAAPMDEHDFRNMLYSFSNDLRGPVAIRYPRGKATREDWKNAFEKIPVGKAVCKKPGEDVAVLTIGHIGNIALSACHKAEKQGVSAAHYDMRFVKPLDEKLLHDIFRQFSTVITVEEGCLRGGFGSAILEFAADHKYDVTITRLGIPDAFIEHGTPDELRKLCGIDQAGILRGIVGQKT